MNTRGYDVVPVFLREFYSFGIPYRDGYGPAFNADPQALVTLLTAVAMAGVLRAVIHPVMLKPHRVAWIQLLCCSYPDVDADSDNPHEDPA